MVQMKKEFNEILDEEANSCHRQRRLQDKRREMKMRLANKGLGYGEPMMGADRCFSCTTFNILAPIYKRLDKEDQSCRESQYRAYWLNRNQSIIDRLLEERSSIICLQEVWLGNDELVEMYEKRLGDAGYISFKLARTNNRGDGLLTAIRRDCFRVLNYREMLFNDFGDRVAQLLHVESVVPFWQSRNFNIPQEILIVNTHLLFPHDYTLSIVRLHQVCKILHFVESYQKEHMLNPLPVILSTGMEVSGAMFTSSLGLRALFPHMMLLIIILIVMQMPISGLVIEIIVGTSVGLTSSGFLILINTRSR